ncbi:MAG TPA: trehalose-phosphatase [Mycobacteriales bacterium]|nr:trehalose-phosphatase [Mycobacteriales bacterium]HVY08787.1 trehalose-phosphatase [Mycobacteriales bacterium]
MSIPPASSPSDVIDAVLADPPSALLALDFDGTLAPIVARPEDARPADGARDVLASLAVRLGGVAIVSGRDAEEIVRLLGIADVPGIQVAGHYGLQLWHDGALTSPEPAPGVAIARARLASVLEGSDPGVRVEDKHHSLAIHTRGASHPDIELAALQPALEDLADACELEAVLGRYVIELRPRGTDKGSALRALVERASPLVVVFVGDDLGDLPAYDVIEALRADGRIAGLTVASVDPADADTPPQVAERADMVLEGPTAVVAWLHGLAAMLP